MTKLQAINTMLSAIGEAPIDDLEDENLPADVSMAIAILDEVTRDTCSMGWKFNMEYGLELPPADTYAWEGTDGTTATLNIFRPPANILGAKVTQSPAQKCLDLTLRKSRAYMVDDELVQVFYDRALNRDGLDSAQYSYLYINPIWSMDFEDLPEVAQRYIEIRSARTLSSRVVGSVTLVSFTQGDEEKAWRFLKREEGQRDKFNMVKTQRDTFGGRRIPHTKALDWRDSPGPQGGDSETDPDSGNGGGGSGPSVAGYTFWFDSQQETAGEALGWRNRATLAPFSSDVQELYSGPGAGEFTPDAINGHPALTNVTADQVELNHAAGSFLPTASYTMFVVVNITAIDDNLAAGVIIGAWPFNYFTDDISQLPPYQLGINDASNTFIPCAPLTTGFHILSISVDSGGNWTVYDNGTSIGTGATLFANGGQWDVRAYDSASFGVTDAVGEILMYPSQLSTPNREAVEEYLAAKWGA